MYLTLLENTRVASLSFISPGALQSLLPHLEALIHVHKYTFRFLTNYMGQVEGTLEYLDTYLN